MNKGAVGLQKAFEEYGLLINSGEFDGMSSEDAKIAITAKMEAEGIGRATTSFRLRDWCLSRQRSWGVGIPAFYCDGCGEYILAPDTVAKVAALTRATWIVFLSPPRSTSETNFML